MEHGDESSSAVPDPSLTRADCRRPNSGKTVMLARRKHSQAIDPVVQEPDDENLEDARENLLVWGFVAALILVAWMAVR